MALDHVRDLLHTQSAIESPTDLSTTTPVLFFTRWITYLCAPTFVFLAGTSAFLSLNAHTDFSKQRKWLLKRGLWLVIAEFTLVNFGMFFDLGMHTLIFEVIATIGFGFIILALLLGRSVKFILIIGVVIFLFHDLSAFIPAEKVSGPISVVLPFFNLQVFPFLNNHVFVMAYPPIPWLGIMLLGFSAGPLFKVSESKRKILFRNIGIGAVLTFVIIRFINIYGDPSPWASQKYNLVSFLSFMNVSKYPPSLQFCLITLGIMFLMLSFSEGRVNAPGNIAQTYGKVPLFYFVVHFYLIHCLLILILFIQGFHWNDMNFANGGFGRPKDKISGLSLGGVYIVWIAVVCSLYLPCKWFGRYKKGNQAWWLKYI